MLSGLPCQQRSYGEGRIVCVCNASYCDTVAPNDPLTSGLFATYTSSRSGLRLEKVVHNMTLGKDFVKQEGTYTVKPLSLRRPEKWREPEN